MQFFVQVYDAYDCEIDFLGPYDTENEAHEAAWAKWEGDDYAYGSRIIPRLPASTH
jgi:hypothetical protein